MEKISVIIPVYNTGKYLNKCIESIIAQTYANLEILLVDDGSEEFTANLCDQLAAKDNRINVFHKINEGVSIARNYGMKKATGDYIGFVDSDDWIDNNMYEVLIEKFLETDADVVFCDARTVWDNVKIEADTFEGVSSVLLRNTDVSPDTLCQMAGSVCRGLYKSSTIKNVYFGEGLKFSEDRYFNLQAIAKASGIFYLKQAFYNRYMRVGSCVNSYHPNGVSIIKKAYSLIDAFVDKIWGKDYVLPYHIQRANLYLAMLYGVFKSGKSFLGKYQEIKAIASDKDVQVLLNNVTINDFRFKLIIHHRYMLLYLFLSVHSFYKILKNKTI